VCGEREPQVPVRLRSGQALGFARDDKGEGSAHLSSRYRGMDRATCGTAGFTAGLKPRPFKATNDTEPFKATNDTENDAAIYLIS
jgi:hypothetical protein